MTSSESSPPMPLASVHPLDLPFESKLATLLQASGLQTLQIGPSEARVMLRQNTGNRPLQKRLVAEYAKEMAAGRWLLSGQPIIFSASGVLNDGQHRLFAILQSGATILSDVRFGIDREAFLVTDQGRKRTGADALSIEKIANSAPVASALRLLFCLDAGDAQFSYKLPPRDLPAFYHEHEGIALSATKAASWYKHFRQIPTSHYAFAHYTLSRLSPTHADQFCQFLADGTGNPNHPADHYRRWVLNVPKGIKQSPYLKIWYLFHAWNLFTTSRTPQKVFWADVKGLPELSTPKAPR